MASLPIFLRTSMVAAELATCPSKQVVDANVHATVDALGARHSQTRALTCDGTLESHQKGSPFHPSCSTFELLPRHLRLASAPFASWRVQWALSRAAHADRVAGQRCAPAPAAVPRAPALRSAADAGARRRAQAPQTRQEGPLALQRVKRGREQTSNSKHIYCHIYEQF
eukprot:6214103-Pleurochrysis_carterae.AAC.4